MKRHKDFYEYKTISFHFFKKVANRYDFKREWVAVRCQEDIMKQQPQNVEIRRLIKMFDINATWILLYLIVGFTTAYYLHRRD